jgi:hypothetical protein
VSEDKRKKSLLKKIADKTPIVKEFIPDKDVICPRCLQVQRVNKLRTDPECENQVESDDRRGDNKVKCGYRFPLLYVNNFEQAKPVPVQVFGWSNHGKTVFLDVLRLTLMGMQRVWPSYVYQSITEADMNKEQELRVFLKNGIMPASTILKGRAENEVYIMQLNGMERWNSRFLIIMDHAGERFKQFELETYEIPFLTHEDTTTLLLISIPMLRGEGVRETLADEPAKDSLDALGDDFGRSMDHLLNLYIQAMVKHDAKAAQKDRTLKRVVKQATQAIRRRRKVVIVLTMADKFVHDLPPRIRDYLIEDNMWDRLYVYDTGVMDSEAVEKYLAEMYEISNAVRDWLMRDIEKAPGGAQLVSMIESHNLEARYCIISATGHDELSKRIEDRDKIGTEISPKRVLDPFFWVLEYQDTKVF